MAALHRLHDAKLVVDHEFNLRERIDFYEKLCLAHGGTQFEDYDPVRGWMNELMDRLDGLARPKYLSHIDSVADNFLFTADGGVRLIDWEYAGMCDPLVDVAMCAIYSYYNEEETDALLGIYLGREASVEERFVVYAYMALGGFLWSLWAIYKSALGVEFGDYTLVMYRYAKKYYRRAMALDENLV
jgi:thiamine kinase-like enzyme